MSRRIVIHYGKRIEISKCPVIQKHIYSTNDKDSENYKDDKMMDIE